VANGQIINLRYRLRPLPVEPLVVRRRYLAVVSSPLPAAPLVVCRRCLIVVLSRPFPRCASQVLGRDAQADARGAAQIVDRGAQAVARGAACCASQSSQVKLILSPKQRAKPAASRTRTCANAAVCIESGECLSRF
jgi:hypothetical protein